MGTVSYTVVDGEIISEDRDGTFRQYVPDPLGSTVALLDQSQAVTDTFSYWPYGEERSHVGTSAASFRFAGVWGYYCQDGVRYVRARNYAPAPARWLSPDPVPSESARAYVYVSGSPTTLVDPSGLGPNPTRVFTKAACRAACMAVYGPNGRTPNTRGLNWCKELCKEFRGTTCGALWAYCEHIARHPTPGAKQKAETCLALHEELCGPDPDSDPLCDTPTVPGPSGSSRLLTAFHIPLPTLRIQRA